MNSFRRQLPNVLTMLRILVIPPLIGAFYMDGPIWAWVPFFLFGTASVTDWLDGYLARQMQTGSRFGKIMDPIADKLLVVSVILLLADSELLNGWNLVPAIIILCREMLISGLREFMAEQAVQLPVTRLAKWKTAAQMGALVWTLAPIHEAQLAGIGFFWLAALLTIITGWDYVRSSWPHMAD